MKKIFLIFAFLLFPVQSSFAGALDENMASQGTVRVIGTVLCEKSIAEGGWGGSCKERSNVRKVVGGGTACEDTETEAGLCNIAWDGIDTPTCCVTKGTELANPRPDQVWGLLASTEHCESPTGMGGDCRDIDSANFGSDLRSLGVDSRDPTCASTNDIVVALCTDNSFWSWDGNDQNNGCCVAKDGPYCRRLQQQNEGQNICSTAGAGGAATSIQYGDYQLLEQIPGSSNTSGELKPYLESIYKAGFVLIILGAIFMIGVGGFTYMASAGNTAMISKGKAMIKDALIGLVVAFFIWLILNIINPDLVNLQIDPLPGLSFDSNNSGANTAATNTASEANNATGSSSFTAKAYSSNLLSDGDARRTLSADGVGVNKSDCSSPSETNCTSLGEMPAVMIGTAVGIRRSCNCSVTVTGGTEAGHSTHGKRRAAMDIRKTPELDAFFSRFPHPGSSGGRPIYQMGNIRVWFEDSEHYHIWEPAN